MTETSPAMARAQTNDPTLFMVATPIGNLEDLTPRALQTLKAAEVILSEDTRRTRALLTHFGISNRVERLDQNSTDSEIRGWVKFLEKGSIALVTDAGTPGVSDPGAKLIAAVRAEALPVSIVPVAGVSAVTALVSVLGWNEPEFSFLGFFPRKDGDRARLFDEIGQLGQLSFGRGALIWFESPHRIREALIWIKEREPSAHLVVAKELTKTFEKVFAGRAAEVSDEVSAHLDREGEVGEWCFALRVESRQQVQSLQGSDEDGATVGWAEALECALESGAQATQSAKVIARKFGVKRETVYAAAVSWSERSKKNR